MLESHPILFSSFTATVQQPDSKSVLSLLCIYLKVEYSIPWTRHLTKLIWTANIPSCILIWGHHFLKNILVSWPYGTCHTKALQTKACFG